jgi:V8-like Glu-specific endopeptidase
MFGSKYNLVKNAVCTIQSTQGTGTAWLYRRPRNLRPRDNSIYIITAAHVLPFEIENDEWTIVEDNISVLISNVNNTNANYVFDVNVISFDKKGDIAVLEIKNHRGENNKLPLNWPKHRTLQINTNKQTVGSQIFIVGFPLSFDYNSFAAGHLRENNATLSFTPTSLFYDFATYPGNSGSPVFNTRNEVIGMLQWGLEGIENINGGITGKILSYVIEKSINDFISSGRLQYKNVFKKNYMNLDNNDYLFYPLDLLIIYLRKNSDYFNLYNDAGKSVDGVLLATLNQFGQIVPTFILVTKIDYIDNNDKPKTLILSSSIDDKDSIWDIHYFAKPGSLFQLYYTNLNTNEDDIYNGELTIMPTLIDDYLTYGFTQSKLQEQIKDKLTNNIEDIISHTQSLCQKLKEKKV